MSLNVNVSGVWKSITEMYVNVSGTWRQCSEVYVNVSGIWKPLLNASGSQSFATAGTYNFTVPAGVFLLNYTVVSGGGAGGQGVLSGDQWGGSGGGSGGYQTGSVAVTPFQVVPLRVGAGGATTGTWGGANNGQSSYISAGSTIEPSAGGGGYGPLGDNFPAYAGAAGSPNGVAGQNINYGRNSPNYNLGGANGTGYGNGGHGNSGAGNVGVQAGFSGYVSLTW